MDTQSAPLKETFQYFYTWSTFHWGHHIAEHSIKLATIPTLGRQWPCLTNNTVKLSHPAYVYVWFCVIFLSPKGRGERTQEYKSVLLTKCLPERAERRLEFHSALPSWPLQLAGRGGKEKSPPGLPGRRQWGRRLLQPWEAALCHCMGMSVTTRQRERNNGSKTPKLEITKGQNSVKKGARFFFCHSIRTLSNNKNAHQS